MLAYFDSRAGHHSHSCVKVKRLLVSAAKASPGLLRSVVISGSIELLHLVVREVRRVAPRVLVCRNKKNGSQ